MPQDPSQIWLRHWIPYLKELRQRILWLFALFVVFMAAGFVFADFLMGLLARPLTNLWQKSSLSDHKLIYTALQEAFLTYLGVGFFTALFLCLPLVSFHIWRFVAPALLKEERASLRPFMILCPLLFFLGAALVYFFIMPLSWRFFLSFETASLGGSRLPLILEARIGDYLSLTMHLMIAFGVGFQLPVVLVILIRLGILSTQTLRRHRRLSIVTAFVAAAILTPPDVGSQIGLALPLILLYEGAILWGRFFEKKDKKFS